jgi:hypothetical protein
LRGAKVLVQLVQPEVDEEDIIGELRLVVKQKPPEPIKEELMEMLRWRNRML